MKKSSIHSLLVESTHNLQAAGIPNPRLDAEVIIAHAMSTDRTWIISHADDILTPRQIKHITSLIKRRVSREPIAYIIGYKEFYGREYIVTPDVLIPRPESETIIDIVKQINHNEKIKKNTRLLDVGCGSGCLGIAAKREMPELDVTLSDISDSALAVARRNANRLNVSVTIQKSTMLDSFCSSKNRTKTNPAYNYIVANLPYVDVSWQRSPETDHEPALALFAEDGGMALIKKCIQQSQGCMTTHGYLLLEADPCLHADIVTYAHKWGFKANDIQDYIIVLQRANDATR